MKIRLAFRCSALICMIVGQTWAFLVSSLSLSQQLRPTQQRTASTLRKATTDSPQENNELLLDRLPTSVDDQVRQARKCLESANYYRHTVRFLLPLIGATELDDWPGGARQQREAALPLVQDLLSSVQEQPRLIVLDESDGVAALLTEGATPADDTCSVLLPTPESVQTTRESLEAQVGPRRNLLFVNPQWRRRSDFSSRGWLVGGTGNNNEAVDYVESFPPTFSLTSLLCEGESIRVLRTYPGPWRVYVRSSADEVVVDWKLVGSQAFEDVKPPDWDQRPENKRDGGQIFSYGQPTYQDIVRMLNESEAYTPKSPAERAAAAFNFIKDSI